MTTETAITLLASAGGILGGLAAVITAIGTLPSMRRLHARQEQAEVRGHALKVQLDEVKDKVTGVDDKINGQLTEMIAQTNQTTTEIADIARREGIVIGKEQAQQSKEGP